MNVYAGLVFSSLTFAGTYHLVKIAVVDIPPMSLVFMRFLCGWFALLPFVLRKPIHMRVPEKKDLPGVILLGFGVYIYHYLYFLSLVYTTPVNSAMIAAMLPIFSSVIAVLCGKEALPRGRVGALLLALCGVLLVISGGDIATLAAMRFNKGDVIMLAGVLCFALYNVGNKGVIARYSAVSSIFFCTTVTIVFSFPFFLYQFKSIVWSAPAVWAASIYMGLFPSGIGFYLQQQGVLLVGVSKAMAFINLVPIFSVGLSVLLWGAQSVTLLQIMSMGLIIAGVLLNSRVRS